MKAFTGKTISNDAKQLDLISTVKSKVQDKEDIPID